MRSLIRNWRIGCRKLWASAGVTATTVVILAMAAGTNAAIYTLADNFFIGISAGRDDDVLLIGARPRDPGQDYFYRFHRRLMEPIEESLTSFERIARVSDFDFTLGGVERPVRLIGLRLGQHAQDILTLNVIRGRSFVSSDFQTDAEHTLLLSSRTWTTAFGGNEQIIGQSVSVNGVPYRIIGILPESFSFKHERYDVVSASSFREPVFLGESGPNIWLIGRLKADVPLDRAISEIRSFEPRLASLAPAKWFDRHTLSVKPLNLRTHTIVRTQIALLLAAGTLILIIAALNLCGVAVGQLTSRRSEYATRIALGASRWNLLGLFALEQGTIVLAGYALAIAVGSVLVHIVVTRFTGAGYGLLAILGDDVALNWRILGLTMLACAGVLAIISSMMLLVSSPTQLVTFLKDEGRSATGGRTLTRVTSALLFVQIACTCVVLIVGGFFLLSMNRVARFDYGYATDGIVQTDLNLPYYRFADGQRAPELTRMMDAVADAIARVPGVAGASTSTLRFPHWGDMQGVRLADSPSTPDDQDLPQVKQGFVSHGLLELVGLRALRGSLLSNLDNRAAAEPTMVVNEAFVEQHFRGRDPIDQFVGVGARRYRITGVVPNLRRWRVERGTPLEMLAEPAIYLPTAFRDFGSWGTLYVKTDSWSASLEERVREAIRSVDRDVVVGPFGTLRDRLEQSQNTFALMVFVQALVASIGALLACLAIYSAVSAAVARRQRELGIRLALGARPSTIRDSVLWYAFRLVAPAVLVGVALSYIGLVQLGLLQDQFFLVDIADRRVYAVASAALLAVGLLASVQPARRAAGVDPMQLFRVR